jgi:Cof subfamily protein (haloacid dehalogenase superfamily)
MLQKLHDIFDIVLIDLDGTLLNDEKKIGNEDLLVLQNLGREGFIRVFATGRNLYSANKVLLPDTPFDYLVFSSGAGILDWKTKNILFQSSISRDEVLRIETILKSLHYSFSIQLAIPDNHKYYFYKGKASDTDFEYRNKLYQEFCQELQGNFPMEHASQFLIFLQDENELEKLFEIANGYNAIRATSPVDGKSIWLEIFDKNVSKASGGRFLCKMLGIPENKSLALGNDYNDLQMLQWANTSYMVENAPESIKSGYKICANNRSNPLSDLILKLLEYPK